MVTPETETKQTQITHNTAAVLVIHQLTLKSYINEARKNAYK